MATVDVWPVPLVVPDPVRTRLVAGLNRAERERADGFRFAADAMRFSVAHGWLRHVLGAELGVPPADVPLADGPGKPRVALAAGPCFNLAHARDLALVAVADREVGVDVEALDGDRVLDAAVVACTGEEAARLDGLPPEERAEAFLRLWTAKEAYLKGTGVGLAVAPDRVEVGPEVDGLAPVRTIGEERATWHVRGLRPLPGYLGAVAAQGDDWVLRLRTSSMTVGAGRLRLT